MTGAALGQFVVPFPSGHFNHSGIARASDGTFLLTAETGTHVVRADAQGNPLGSFSLVSLSVARHLWVVPHPVVVPGCPGAGGFVPTLAASGPAVAGNPLTLTISQATGGATAFLAFGLWPVEPDAVDGDARHANVRSTHAEISSMTASRSALRRSPPSAWGMAMRSMVGRRSVMPSPIVSDGIPLGGSPL